MEQSIRISEQSKRELEALSKLERVRNLKQGHFSTIFILKDINGKPYKFRFQKDQEKLHIKLYNGLNKENAVSSENKIGFYDRELEMKLFIKKEDFLKQCEEEVNFNLSNEQKELLVNGKDITLEVNLVNSTLKSQKKINVEYKCEFKNFVADLSFFLGKTSNLIVENRSNTNKMTITRTNVD